MLYVLTFPGPLVTFPQIRPGFSTSLTSAFLLIMDHENIYQAPVATLTPATVNLDDKSLITPPETSLRNTDGQILPITITEQDDTVMAEPGVTHKEDTIDTWNFQPQEEIDLLSVRDGNDDMTGAFATLGSPSSLTTRMHQLTMIL